MEATIRELPGYPSLPSFSVPRADDLQMSQSVRSLHAALKSYASPLECESKFLLTLIELIKRYGDKSPSELKTGSEHLAVKKVRSYIDENYAQPLALSELAEYVHFS